MAHSAIMPTPSITKTTTNVLLVSVVIAAANPKRRGVIIWNNSANSCYVSLDLVSTSAACAWIIPTFASKEYYGPACYTGPLSAIRNSGSGTVTVWELEE